jgi:ABC-type antimicrobial peptide transport system permease subunit
VIGREQWQMVVIGIIAGVAPARRAAAMDPVEALRAE